MADSLSIATNNLTLTPSKLLRQPKQKRSVELVNAICDATIQVLKEHGWRNLSTNLIAKTGGFDISSLYRFFPNKAAIVSYVYAQWLLEIRNAVVRFEAEEEFLELGWRDYFTKLVRIWQSDQTADYYESMEGALIVFPELAILEFEHREFYVEFLIRQMKRFGAKGTRQQLSDLALYFYVVEDELHSKSIASAFSSKQVARELYLESMLYQLERIMPTKIGHGPC